MLKRRCPRSFKGYRTLGRGTLGRGTLGRERQTRVDSKSGDLHRVDSRSGDLIAYYADWVTCM